MLTTFPVLRQKLADVGKPLVCDDGETFLPPHGCILTVTPPNEVADKRVNCITVDDEGISVEFMDDDNEHYNPDAAITWSLFEVTAIFN